MSGEKDKSSLVSLDFTTTLVHGVDSVEFYYCNWWLWFGSSAEDGTTFYTMNGENRSELKTVLVIWPQPAWSIVLILFVIPL